MTIDLIKTVQKVMFKIKTKYIPAERSRSLEAHDRRLLKPGLGAAVPPAAAPLVDAEPPPPPLTVMSRPAWLRRVAASPVPGRLPPVAPVRFDGRIVVSARVILGREDDAPPPPFFEDDTVEVPPPPVIEDRDDLTVLAKVRLVGVD